MDEEFDKTLINSLSKKLNSKNYDDDIIDKYIEELQNFMNEEKAIKNKIFKVTYKLINNNKNDETNYKDIIDKLYNNNNINKYIVDINS